VDVSSESVNGSSTSVDGKDGTATTTTTTTTRDDAQTKVQFA
jgi:hypothetical protein